MQLPCKILRVPEKERTFLVSLFLYVFILYYIKIFLLKHIKGDYLFNTTPCILLQNPSLSSEFSLGLYMRANMSFFIHYMLVSILPMILEVSDFAMLSLILPDLVSVA